MLINLTNFPNCSGLTGELLITTSFSFKSENNSEVIQLTIILDDYQKRKEYHCLNKFFQIKKIGRLGVLKPKKKLYLKKNIMENFYYNYK